MTQLKYKGRNMIKDSEWNKLLSTILIPEPSLYDVYIFFYTNKSISPTLISSIIYKIKNSGYKP